MKIDRRPIFSATKICSPVTLVSGGIRFNGHSRRFPGRGHQTTVGLSRTAIFSVFAGYFSNTLEMRPVLLYSDTQSVVGFFSDPKMQDLE